MPAKRGALATLKKGDGATPEVFTLIGGIQTIGWRFGNEPIETTTQEDIDPNGVSYRTFIPGIANSGGDVVGIAKDFSIQDMVDDSMQGIIRNYQVYIPNYGTITAPMSFVNVESTNPHDGVAGFSATLVLSGAPFSIVKDT